MFTWKKPQDFHSSLQRFSDLSRDASSRAKHFRLIFENLTIEEKRQLIESFGFELFHLIDSFILCHYGQPIEQQTIADIEMALGILEIVLINAPEFVGIGWQRNGIEFILKMVLHPRNEMAVRKLAIRLFIIWYQILAVYGRTSENLDTAFKSCLPHLPLHGDHDTELILTIFCEGFGSTFSASDVAGLNSELTICIAKSVPVVVCSSTEINIESSQKQQILIDTGISFREKAKILQIYLDKFLEYIIRETMRINWSNSIQRLECARFLLDRIISLYVFELFPEAVSSVIDVYNVFDSALADEMDDERPILETAEPKTIAKYWLIRFFLRIAEISDQVSTNTASSSDLTSWQNMSNNTPGLSLFKQALFSSQKAINILLTMMREAFWLPLSCVNVIQKVLSLIHNWLLQHEIPYFLDSKKLSMDLWTLLLIRMIFSFFRSPYLIAINDRLPSAISITHNILKIVRDLTNPLSMHFVHNYSKSLWEELIKVLISVMDLCITRPDAFGQATTAGFTRTLLGALVFVQVLREVNIDNHFWDSVLCLFQNSVWKSQIIEQWSRLTINITKALILNLFAVDVCGSNDSCSQKRINSNDEISDFFCSENNSCHNLKTSDSSSAGTCPCENSIIDLPEHHRLSSLCLQFGEHVDFDNDLAIVWLRTWMRIICLVDTTMSVWKHCQQSAVQTYGRTVDMLIRTCEGAQPINAANALIYWLSIQVIRLDVAEQPHALPILFSILNVQPLPLPVRVFILHRINECLRTEEVAPLVLEHIPSINTLEDMAIISTETIATLQRLIKNQEFSARAIRVAALLSLNHPEAEKILISLLEMRCQSQQQLDQFSLSLCVNALSLLILERADAALFDRLLHLLINHQYAGRILPTFCANIGSVIRVGFHSQLVDAIQLALSKAKNNNMLNDLKWQLCTICAKECIALQWRETLAERFRTDKDNFFEGFVIRLSGQYPLPGFHITQWNSLYSIPEISSTTEKEEFDECTTCIKTGSSILSFGKEGLQLLWCRTTLGRYAYQMEVIEVEDEQNVSVDNWLHSLANSNTSFQATLTRFDDEIMDRFQELPYPNPRYSTPITLPSYHLPLSSFVHKADLIPLNISVPEMLQFIQSSTRVPEEDITALNGCDCVISVKVNSETNKQSNEAGNLKGSYAVDWRKFIATFGFFESANDSPSNFHREIRHLDSTVCREVHKVAVIYVGGGSDLQDKHSILSNNTGSEIFNKFVDRLGWPIQIGSSEFYGYTGGLSSGHMAIYYASASTEIIFHISTLLLGDITQRLKHLGNDEVHVVWSESTKPYRRDMIATRFCDVLIVLYLISPVLLRIHIEVQDQRLQFGPLFDGACIHISQASALVRETVLNASHAYRNLRLECDRPNKYREKVFHNTKKMLKPLSLSSSITRLLRPRM